MRGLPTGGPDDDPKGWSDLAAWVDDRLADARIRRREDLRPVRVWARSAVARFGTDRGPMWVKAVPEVFSHEVALTGLLADIDPGIAPPVVAADARLGRILMDHVEGPLLADVGDPVAWTATLSRLAELQRVLAADLIALQVAGVAAAPLDRLATEVPRLLGDDTLLGVGHEGGLAAAEASRLRALEDDLVVACRALADGPVPDSLDHGDLRPTQVILGEMGPVVLDWSDGSITHPFLAAASFLAAADRIAGGAPATGDALADAYLGPWLAATGLSAAEARTSLELARTVHPLHVALLYADRILPGLERTDGLDRVVPDHLRTLL